jgi:hypothetical protein
MPPNPQIKKSNIFEKNTFNNRFCWLNDFMGPTLTKIFFVLIILFILVMVGVYAKINNTDSAFILVLCFLITILSLGVFFSFYSVFNTLYYSNKLVFLIIFICGIIILVTELSKSELKNNASYLFPLILIITGVLFYYNVYKTINYNDLITNFYSNNNRFLENTKISSIIIYICLCIFLFILYNSSIGKYAMDSYNKTMGTHIKINMGMILTFIILILIMGLLLVFDIFGIKNIKDDSHKILNKNNIFKLFGFMLFVIMFVWIVMTLSSYSNTGSGFVNFIINAFFIVIILGVIFRLIASSDLYNKNPLLRFIINSIFYIPCLFYPIIEGSYNFILKLFTGISSSSSATRVSGVSGIKTQNEATANNFILLIIVILLYISYFAFYPYLIYDQQTQNGLLLVNNPISIRNKTTLASYQTLHGSEDFDYQYGLSFWLYLDSENPSVNLASNKYTSVIHYGDKFHLEYNVRLNTMRLIVLKNGIQTTDKVNKSYDELYDVIFEMKDILLQKWNNIIINYNGGTLDIFYNGSLVKSKIEVVPFMEYDTLDLGSDKGIFGRVCNVNYFKQTLISSQIYNLYNSVKDKTPPIVSEINKTIMNISEYTIKPMSSFNTSDPDYDVNLPTGDELPDDKDVPKQKPDPKNISDFTPDYLSLKWYFTANKDKQNV